MRTIRIAAFVAISLMSTSFSVAEESRLAFVFAAENRAEAETRLVTLRDGVEIGKVPLGNVGLFTSTSSRLFVLAQNEDGYILRCWDLRNGRELPLPKLQSLAVDPIVRMNGFTGTMCVDVRSSTLLYRGARSDMVDEETGESEKTKNDANKSQDGKIKRKRKVHKTSYIIGGISLDSGAAFNVILPGEVKGSDPMRPHGDTVGGFFDNNSRFMLYDSVNRRFDPESLIPDMNSQRRLFAGLGIVDTDPNYVCIRVTDEKLRRLDPPEPLIGGESLKGGEVRFCRDPDGSLSAVTFISQKEPAQCKVAWRDPFTGKASYQHTFQIGYPLMRVSGDGRLCLLDDVRDKRAILIDRRGEKVTEIDYSRYERAQLVMSISDK